MKRRILSLTLTIALYIGLFATVPVTANTNTAINLATESTASTIAVNSSSSYAITADGNLWTWGEKFESPTNRRPPNAGNIRSRPEKIMDGVKSIITVGFDTMYAIRNDGSLWGWGGNSFFVGHGLTPEYGTVGSGSSERYVTSPVKILDNVASVIIDDISHVFAKGIAPKDDSPCIFPMRKNQS
jgi:alpha-tubulin suppressor-like RCC1 family protein